MKSNLHGTRFRDDDELKAATEAWFEDQIDDFYFKGIDCLKEKWAKCTEVKGIILKNNVETIFQSELNPEFYDFLNYPCIYIDGWI